MDRLGAVAGETGRAGSRRAEKTRQRTLQADRARARALRQGAGLMLCKRSFIFVFVISLKRKFDHD
ncbi:hypothetical protein THICB1_30165 [Thiomonas arsenitoxydans]|uniref:Uncharacterized protein n=1 Tax=Thiomonas arsenitoxydans (strain DSM 22701 / CIP 110005 / 3As) TaxID=426114 RepID=A0ABP1Z5Y7_THIA3|nr:hypothetical protein ACO7_350042 [Thiomonas arsenitoxydans]CQR33544.1 hypothetical protein THICB1_30165 [Thiomonas arsenitoxydans]CQR39981.1 hypothetical protein THICB6_80165 [Thiomonas arsenitoxydans]